MVAACGSTPPAPALHNEAPAPGVDPGGLAIRLERTACLGACPEYRVAITRDGHVDWHGIANVRVLGDAHGSIDQRHLNQLAVLLDMAKFYARERDGHLGKSETITICTDLPSVKLEATDRGHHNAIEYDGCQKDQGLEDLIDQIEDIARTVTWR